MEPIKAISELNRCQRNAEAFEVIRQQFEKINLTDPDVYQGHINTIDRMIDEMAADEVNYYDSVKAELVESCNES